MKKEYYMKMKQVKRKLTQLSVRRREKEGEKRERRVHKIHGRYEKGTNKEKETVERQSRGISFRLNTNSQFRIAYVGLSSVPARTS
jgi:hypothetical protein